MSKKMTYKEFVDWSIQFDWKELAAQCTNYRGHKFMNNDTDGKIMQFMVDNVEGYEDCGPENQVPVWVLQDFELEWIDRKIENGTFE